MHTLVCVHSHLRFVCEEEFADFCLGTWLDFPPASLQHTKSKNLSCTDVNDGIPTNLTGQGLLPRSSGERTRQVSILVYFLLKC